jgi:hypothetical protein
MTSPSRKAIS